MNVFVLKNGYKQISVVANGVYDMLKNQNVVYALKLWCWNFFQTKFQPLEVTHLMSMDGWQKNTQNMTSLKTNKQKPYANVHWRRNNRSGDSNRCSTQRIQYTCYVAILKCIVPFYIYLTISIAHIFAAREWVLFSLFFVIFLWLLPGPINYILSTQIHPVSLYKQDFFVVYISIWSNHHHQPPNDVIRSHRKCCFITVFFIFFFHIFIVFYGFEKILPFRRCYLVLVVNKRRPSSFCHIEQSH